MATIKIMQTPAEVEACYAVMAQLRPGFSVEEFMTEVDHLMTQGYELHALVEHGEVCSVAGLRVMESLGRGRYVYVDDLVTADKFRSQGCGRKLLSAVKEYAQQQNCRAVHLDSAVTRHGAHRFYLDSRMDITGYHFCLTLV